MADLEPQTTDVDKWEISMSPNHYLSHFDSIMAMVTLASHAPKFRLGSEFEGFILLAESTHQLWIHETYKTPFLESLKKHRTVQTAAYRWQITYGGPVLPVRVLVDCLNDAKCETIHVKTFGQKLPVDDGSLSLSPAAPA